jgi:catechol 2,3-dioxygenase-like lactoylglutathione lyase family enzyme
MAILPRGLHSHTTLETTDIAKALRFYWEVLGLSTAQQMPKVGLLRDTRDHIAAIIQLPKISSQPYWNYYARPVPRTDIDRLHVAVSAVAEEYELREVTEPAHEQRYGIGTYGFAIADRDGNWWRIEDQDGPFGLAELPAVEATSIVPPGPVAYVTLESADLDKTSRFYREFIGLDVVHKEGALHCAEHGGINLIVVPAQQDPIPQTVLNHHGLTLDEGERSGVERAFALITEHGDRWGIRKVQQITDQHGSYSFYFQDLDTNWWEVETLYAGLNPWQRVSQPPGSHHLLNPAHGANTIRRPYRDDNESLPV